MSRTQILGGSAIILMAGLFLGFNTSSQPPSPSSGATRTITIGESPVHVEVVDTDALRAQGLSGHAPLAPDEGMLFVFDADGIYPFWMKDMLFSIDILWLDARGKVVHIEKNISPDTYPASFTPDSPARYVLEVPAGFADQHDIQIGATATLGE
jgi:uncharacterized membrane protein (UPF0127 family)